MRDGERSEEVRRVDALTHEIIGAAIEVHRELGPGLLESAYEACLAQELTLRNVRFEQQKPLPVVYRGINVDCGYRIDLVVDGCVVVELKSIDHVDKIHKMQVLSYSRLAKLSVGLLINFNVPVLVQGVSRIVNELKE